MKRILIVLISFIGLSSVKSQNIDDAMLYAQDNINGTARFRAMSGAFGALGGDFSSLNINPAGSVVFSNNQIGFTLGNFNIKNDSDYFGDKKSENNNTFDINQLGGVYVFENEDKKSDWKKFAVALNYDNQKNFNNSIAVTGTNPTNSVANYFLSYANGIPLSVVNGSDFSYPDLFYDEQQAYLGYNAFIINEAADYDNVTNRSYVSLVPNGGNYYQENSIETTGYNGKLAFNGSAQYKDKLSVGININAHFSDYRKSSSFFESNTNNTSTDYLVRRIRFNNELYTYGTGFSFQLGTIYKATKELRLGLAYESPTWMRLFDELTQSVSAVSGNSTGELTPDNVNPQITMIYEPYKLQTPGKYTASIAYVFAKKGLLSFDYALKDYSNTKFLPKNDYQDQNNLMSNVLDTTNEFRIGAEYKIKQVSLRGGYRFEQSPYKNEKTIGDLTGYSGGIGYNFGNTKLDLAYSFAKRDYQQQMFSQGLTDVAKINSKNNSISVSLQFEL
ncbi:OmpP1/FadL family transporter [Flavobacterium sp.]|uniref:OmpP1/FadL family transporter n=1 Tax=Flavobacterium sp. TaxID=239 RepID=UPI003750A72F